MLVSGFDALVSFRHGEDIVMVCITFVEYFFNCLVCFGLLRGNTNAYCTVLVPIFNFIIRAMRLLWVIMSGIIVILIRISIILMVFCRINLSVISIGPRWIQSSSWSRSIIFIHLFLVNLDGTDSTDQKSYVNFHLILN